MTTTSGGSRLLVFVLIVIAAAIALAPVAIGRARRVRVMRTELELVLTECRRRYAAAPTAADTAEIDGSVPHASTGSHPGDPACGRYRRRNMLREG